MPFSGKIKAVQFNYDARIERDSTAITIQSVYFTRLCCLLRQNVLPPKGYSGTQLYEYSQVRSDCCTHSTVAVDFCFGTSAE
jgi:hypothetical protein